MNKKIASGVVLFVMISPLIASAQTSSGFSIFAAIGSILHQIELDLEQLFASAPSAPGSSATSTSTARNATSTFAGPAAIFCTEDANLKQGDTDATTNGAVSKLQLFLGITPTTGVYGPQTTIGFQNKCGNLGNSQPTSVPGMSEYTSADFTFWYPSSWTIKQVKTGGTIVASLSLRNPAGTQMMYIDEITPNQGLLNNYIDTNDSEAFFFDTHFGVWEYSRTSGGKTTNTPVNTLVTTMGGLHMFSWESVPAMYGEVVPLSAARFVTIDDSSSKNNVVPLVETIIATNPNVATPVSTAQQTATIQTEASAYGVKASSTPPASTFSADPTSGSAPLMIDFSTPDTAPFLFVFGDGTSMVGNTATSQITTGCGYTCGWTHTYSSTGTYSVALKDLSGNILDMMTITVTGSSASSLQTYANSQYGFSIQYPNTLRVNPPCTENNGPESCTSQNLISFYATASQSANGFAYGYVIVPTPSVVGRCASDPGNGVGTYSTKTINGITFGVYGIGSAAAGTQEAITTYSTERNGLCYSIVEDEYDNYTGGAYAGSQAKTDLESIVQTFHFTD